MFRQYITKEQFPEKEAVYCHSNLLTKKPWFLGVDESEMI
ncbi:hypothetical protein DSOL_4867 [Desulfosporosinus metallidurans]|uniref:Uncharacterized protein n=1 Tax=Desulfosporosinus metallidurans TaxID=1888891 RepID=A0A1Q8QH86_9FIRM|nr:hypothetical protein DSOL_4867 [Desulfosporosinus metallidurans]